MSADLATSAGEFTSLSRDSLVEAIKKENSKARTKGAEMRRCMERIGCMLIELKTKVPHGNFMATAANLTGIPHRSITRYMEWALRPITSAELKRIDAPEDMMKSAKPATPPPASKLATVANSTPAESPPASSRPRPSTEGAVDAEIVEPQAKTVLSPAATPPPVADPEEDDAPALVVDGTKDLNIGKTMELFRSEGGSVTSGMEKARAATWRLDEIKDDDPEIRKALEFVVTYCRTRQNELATGRTLR